MVTILIVAGVVVIVVPSAIGFGCYKLKIKAIKNHQEEEPQLPEITFVKKDSVASTQTSTTVSSKKSLLKIPSLHKKSTSTSSPSTSNTLTLSRSGITIN